MDQDPPQHAQTNDENESNSFDNALENDSLDQLFQEIEDAEEAYARPYHTTHDIIRKQLQLNAIRGVLHKPSCGDDAGEPFESKPQIKQTKAEVHYVRHLGEPESDEGNGTESKSYSDSKIDNSESQPEPQIKQTEAEERRNLTRLWSRLDWGKTESEEVDVTEFIQRLRQEREMKMRQEQMQKQATGGTLAGGPPQQFPQQQVIFKS